MSNMDYELAKRLKDVGFPQKEPLVYPPYVVKSAVEFASTAEMEGVYIPTLSELIEACSPFIRDGKDGEDTYFAIHAITDGTWNSGYYWYELPYISVYGGTLEESVANLWLELNKQKDK